MSEELWKSIPGCEGAYEAHPNGEIRSLDRMVPRRKSGSTPSMGRILKVAVNRGYGVVTICAGNGARKMHLVHRLIAKTFIANPDNKPQINHKDGNPLNNSVDNLEWATRSQNQIHRYDVLKRGGGENHGLSKLKKENIYIIRLLHLHKVPYKEIAKIFGVAGGTVSSIFSGRSWRGVGEFVDAK